MRNIKQYPITKEEIIKALEKIQIDSNTADLATNMSLAPMILKDILNAAKYNPNWLKMTFNSDNYKLDIKS